MYRQHGQVSRRIIVAIALAQLACDMTAICSMIHFVGGIENFFIVLILLPLVIATELLPRPLAYGTAVLAVADTGIGISEGDRDKLFQEFFRSYKARQVFPEGTGMGLVICKRIVEMHHGSIAADPGPEGGTTFSVWLPRSAKHTDHAQPPD